MSRHLVTLARQIRDDQQRHSEATGAFSNLLEHVALAAKVISREVNKAGLVDLLGFTGETNVQGEEVRKLDVFAHDTLVAMLKDSGYLAGMASEETEDVILLPRGQASSEYVVLFDPLDGSSNIDANVSVGTIFSVLRRVSRAPRAQLEDFLQPGCEQVAAGYVIYGSSTMLVYTTGTTGVHGFTLDASVGEFILSHPGIRIPRRGKVFSVNMGNRAGFSAGVTSYLDHLTSDTNRNGKPYSLRYIGSLVADFHRNLLHGGVFLYPADHRNPQGKLRLLYEANPLGFVVSEAGGKVSSGQGDLLALRPERLHQRVPLVIGSYDDVVEAEEFLQGGRGSGRDHHGAETALRGPAPRQARRA